MADKSKIEWTDATWNPIRGCSVVSEGCRNCYAMRDATRFTGKGHAYEGLAYRNESGAHWTGQVKLIEEHLEDPLRWKRPRLVFVNSMSDLFHASIPDEWIDRIFAVMALAPLHVFQILTKRPERMADYLRRATPVDLGEQEPEGSRDFSRCIAECYMQRRNNPGVRRAINTPEGFPPRGWEFCSALHPWPLPNLWLGISCENQKTADERIPLLLQTPAAVRWISAEPLLGPMSLSRWMGPFEISRDEEGNDLGSAQGGSDLDWVVVGGESGAGARPMHPDWARSLRDQCVEAGVPFFFKQWGEWDGAHEVDGDCQAPCGRCVLALREWNGSTWRGSKLTGTDWGNSEQPGALQIHRVGKHKAGRLLDYREWNEYPDIELGGA